MAQRTHIHDDEIEPEQAVFLKRHGIEPINGSFSEHQLVRALIRRGWRSELSPEHVAIM